MAVRHLLASSLLSVLLGQRAEVVAVAVVVHIAEAVPRRKLVQALAVRPGKQAVRIAVARRQRALLAASDKRDTLAGRQYLHR